MPSPSTTSSSPSPSAPPPPKPASSLAHRFRLPAIGCALAVLLCELISRPYANMGICDDPAYIASARILASTGHIVYVGAAAAMLGAQLYIGAAFIKLFGDSFTSLRFATLFVSTLTAFFVQRFFARFGISERNATIGTLALCISPLFLVLSMTYMSDMYGLFATILCLYCCLRALQSPICNYAIGWLALAVTSNAVFGTARQIAWLGTLVLVPSTLWLLRRQRHLLLAGIALILAGILFIVACMTWFRRQPYALGLPTGTNHISLAHTSSELIHTFLDIPFLLLPILAVFIPCIYKSRPRIFSAICAFSLGYLLLAVHWRRSHPDFLLEPTQGNWLTPVGAFQGLINNGIPPHFLQPIVQILFTMAAIGGLLGVLSSLFSASATTLTMTSAKISWRQSAILLGPFTTAYVILLVPSATNAIYDRYTPVLLVVVTLCLLRYYQERIHTRLPLFSIVLLTAMAIYGIVINHNMFSFYEARARMAAEIRAAGVPDTSVDNGWEYNFQVELQHASHINDPGIVTPKDAYTPAPPLLPGTCPTNGLDRTPHIHPIYGISYCPNACYGPAPFAPVHYSRWLASSPGTLYVVKYLPPNSPQYRH